MVDGRPLKVLAKTKAMPMLPRGKRGEKKEGQFYKAFNNQHAEESSNPQTTLCMCPILVLICQ